MAAKPSVPEREQAKRIVDRGDSYLEYMTIVPVKKKKRKRTRR